MRIRALLLAPLACVAALALPASAVALPACAGQPEVRVVADGLGALESIGFDERGRVFFTDGDAGELLMIGKRGAEPRVVADGIDGPGGIVFQRHSGRVLVGFGNAYAQAVDGTLNPEGGLLRVDPRNGQTAIHTDGLQAANGIARGPGRALFASNALTGGIDRIVNGTVQLNWAPVSSANGMIADRSRKALFVNQTLGPAAIVRVPLSDPGMASTYWSAPVGDIAGGLDGLTSDGRDNLYAAANAGGAVWRVDRDGTGCELAHRQPFPAGPSDLAFGRKGAGFSRDNLYVTTFGGELLELVGARG